LDLVAQPCSRLGAAPSLNLKGSLSQRLFPLFVQRIQRGVDKQAGRPVSGWLADRIRVSLLTKCGLSPRAARTPLRGIERCQPTRPR